MSKLILSLDGMVLREYKLEKNTVTIGRKAHNDIQIDNLAVSGEHARLNMIGNDVFLEDLESTNGTQVNGQPVQRQLLQDGDLVELGKYKLKFMQETGAAKAAAGGGQEDFEKTMVIRPGAVKPAAPAAPAAASAPPPPKPATATPVYRSGDTVMELPQSAPKPAPSTDDRPAAIKVLTGGNAGKSLELVKNLTSLGKPGVQVAILTRRPTGFFITHVEGPSRPLVNGNQIGVQAELLKDHDVIELAGVKMEFYYK
ncbi:FHA domain-containing protein [Chitinimonas arctica]|uniref:FHA domain-containing protein n=1 Tax=Chitinimonas arctica TaxID=2594795 RepID=A0A516SDQ7_9NEIS|nr:FHA domain-containing protein [Chitinimonas arctica]QDQ26279.1 FHA domain-containing protein [Chitinimonas arctica]